ncbi:uncharacterized protein UMAG_00362 [Mycosarcoma maydis]|uniref:MOSC domain-containing protein n=1 Tax=Mycosarcoma maydis TaxID=5270 RepID=A0A0D1EC78_MYCMD|nr:uncharacterized protein UMAG_00362 [Ustilago maydis 521]KIS71935.1 hypothetical protein UMAG_00362 [Ustilago maydis 521]|eukprot:XP_011386253.1 hypothetical protein UMAG_00362 [Ustilago maydis 521]
MPAKLPFLDASESLQQRWREATSPTRISAQIYVFLLLITIGLLRQYLFPSKRSNHTYGSSLASTEPGAKDETLGEISEIFIYPIKSCAGVSVSKAQLTEQGFDLDRRWMVVRTNKQGKLEKISLREEPRLTLIQPEIDELANTLALRLTDVGRQQETARNLGETGTPLRPSAIQLKAWKQVASVEMYGDYADGRVAALAEGGKHKFSPSEWISEFLGYPVLLLHFDTTSTTTRNAFPIFKPPTDSFTWSSHDRSELYRKRRIEFQDEYPLLVASAESLDFVRSQLSSALTCTDGDGRGGRAITGIDATKWSDPTTLSIARFRPNIVVKGNGGFGAFSEDSWERIWILSPSSEQSSKPKAMLQLVARCQRCLLTAVDPISAEKDPSVPLKLLSRSRMRVKKVAGVQGGNGRAGPCFGMYAIPLPLGRDVEDKDKYGGLVKGDAIRVRWRPFELDDEPDRQCLTE